MLTHYPILVIDDDPDVVDTFSRAAKALGLPLQLIAVYSFAEATAYLEGLRGPGPRLILLDINLTSALTGLDLLTHLRQHPQGHLVPIVIFSNDANPARIREALSLGAVAYTLKPYSYREWKAYLEQIHTYWYQTVSVPRLWFQDEETVIDEASGHQD